MILVVNRKILVVKRKVLAGNCNRFPAFAMSKCEHKNPIRHGINCISLKNIL